MATETQSVDKEAPARGRMKTKVGKVVSAKMQKSVVVAVERRVKHPLYAKYISHTSRMICHDENNECKEGDQVEIVETKPMSRNKSWKVGKILRAAAVIK